MREQVMGWATEVWQTSHWTNEQIKRIERFHALVRNAALEEAARYCHDASIPQPDLIHTDAQWAAACLAVNLRSLKEPTP